MINLFSPQLITAFACFLQSQAVVPVQADWFEKYGWAVVLLLLTNGVQYAMSRKKTKAETTQMDVATVQSLLKTVKEIQDANDGLFEKIQFLRKNAAEVDDVLDETERKLEECIERNADCDECRAVTVEARDAFHEISSFLRNIEGAERLLENIQALSEKLSRIKIKPPFNSEVTK